MMATIRATANEDDTSDRCVIRLKNATTGDFIMDEWNQQNISPYFEAGSREIITLTTTQLFDRYLYQARYATY